MEYLISVFVEDNTLFLLIEVALAYDIISFTYAYTTACSLPKLQFPLITIQLVLFTHFALPSASFPIQFSSVQFIRSVMSDSLQPHELQHTRPPCPSPTSGVHPNSCPSSQWCHPAISSSVVPFSSSLPASESFPMSQLFTWGGQILEFQL